MKKSRSIASSGQPEADVLIYQNQLLKATLALSKLRIDQSHLENATASIAKVLLQNFQSSFVGFALRFTSTGEDRIFCYTPSGESDTQHFRKLAEQIFSATPSSFDLKSIPETKKPRFLGSLPLGDQVEGILLIDDFVAASDDCPLLRDFLAEIARKVPMKEWQGESVSSAFFESNYAMMLLIDPSTGLIVDANPAAVKHYGWSREEMRGMPLSDVNTLSPTEIRIAMKDAVAGKRNLFHFQHRRADGSICDVDILSGKILYRGRQLLYSIVHDAGVRRAIEEDLAQERQRLQFILDAAEYGTWEWNLQTKVVSINETLAQIVGYSVKELELTTDLLRAHCHPDDFQKSKSMLKRCLSEENLLFESEIRLKHRSGHWVWTLARGQVVTRDALEEPLQMFGTLASIQDRKAQEAEREVFREQMTQSQKMESVGRLAGGIAHDFNNLLTVILGHAESALMDLGSKHPIADDLREIRDSAQKSALLTRQLLTFARRQLATPQLINLDDTIGSMLESLKESIKEQVALNWSPGIGNELVKLDPLQVNQMLDNLVRNASDAVSDDGIIDLATTVLSLKEGTGPKEKPGDYVVVSVSDNGRGMDQTTLARLYEPFFTTKEVGKGTGLGLSTVDGIVNQNQGFIRVQSQLRKGTEFKVFLPVASERVPDVVKAAPKAKRTDYTETILIVEDEPSVLLLAERILKRRGYRILSAGLPEIAIEIFKANKEKIDLLLTDVMMPGMNGPEMAKRILKEAPNLKCLYMSGYSAETIAERGLLDRTVQVLEKPFCANGLSRKVREVLDS